MIFLGHSSRPFLRSFLGLPCTLPRHGFWAVRDIDFEIVRGFGAGEEIWELEGKYGLTHGG